VRTPSTPHFLNYYSAVGIDHFFFAVDEAIASSVESVTRHWPCTAWRTADAAESLYGVKAVSDMRRRHCEPDEWVVIADLDEFHLYPAPLPTLISSAETEGSNNIHGTMVDMLAEDGGLPPLPPPDGDLWALFPRRCALTRRLRGGADTKCDVVRETTPSHHCLIGEKPRDSSTSYEIAHFKWHEGAIERMEHALAVTRDVGEHWWVEYERLLEHWRLHGRFRWEDFPVDKRFALTAGQREGMSLAWIQENLLLRRS
jgi:hypothetical protein